MTFSSKKARIFLVLAVLALAGIGYVILHWNQESTDDAQIDATVVSVSPKVAGYVKTLNVSDNTKVKAGDVLLEIDPTDYQLKHDRAAADVESAQAQILVAQVAKEKADKDLARVQKLGKLASSEQQLDNAETMAQMSEAGLAVAKSRLVSSQAALDQTTKDLNDTKIIASMDGQVLKGTIAVGNYVQPGQQLFSLVGNDIWVVANFKENQLKDMRVGQKVDIDIDTYSGHKFTGKIDSFQSGTGSRFSAFPAENATGNFVKIVQRVPVKVTFDKAPDPSLPIGPGMSVNATVYTK